MVPPPEFADGTQSGPAFRQWPFRRHRSVPGLINAGDPIPVWYGVDVERREILGHSTPYLLDAGQLGIVRTSDLPASISQGGALMLAPRRNWCSRWCRACLGMSIEVRYRTLFAPLRLCSLNVSVSGMSAAGSTGSGDGRD